MRLLANSGILKKLKERWFHDNLVGDETPNIAPIGHSYTALLFLLLLSGMTLASTILVIEVIVDKRKQYFFRKKQVKKKIR